MTFRLLATADNHWNEHSRFDECVKVHHWMVDLARDVKADLAVSAGDIFESLSTPTERQGVAEWLRCIGEVCAFLISKGNHDRKLDTALMSRIRSKHPITVEEGAGVHYIGGAAIATIAWPERAALMALAGTIEGTEQLVREALQAVFRKLGAEVALHDGPRLALGHLMIDGSIASTGQPLLGMPINVGLEDLQLLNAHLGIAGHIHAAQRWELSDGGVWLYPGSPFRTDYSQTEKKSVIFAEFDGQRLVKLEQIETPCSPMLHIESTWSMNSWDALRGLDNRDMRGAEVRWRYQVAPDQREAAAASAREWEQRFLADGAKSVKLEPEIILETRARAPEVAAAVTLPAKLDAHWGSTGYDPGDRRQALHTKASELEQEEASRAA